MNYQNINNRTHKSAFCKNQRGLTLIEIMVAVSISLFLLGGVIQIFGSNKQVYRVQDASARIQESGRFGMYFLTKAIRNADFWGCMGRFPEVNNHLNPGAGNPIDLSQGGIAGTDGDGLNGSDTLILLGGNSDGIGVDSYNYNAAAFSVSVADSGVNPDDFIMATDCENADLLQVTSTTTSTMTITGNTGTGSPGNATKPGFNYSSDTGSRLFKFETTTYSLGLGSGGTEPSLYRTTNGGAAVELVEGVEDMQILYGEDTDADGAANRYVPAGTAGLVMTEVVAIRVTLQVRSAEDHVNLSVNNGDNRLRRTFTTTTTIRNRVS